MKSIASSLLASSMTALFTTAALFSTTAFASERALQKYAFVDRDGTLPNDLKNQLIQDAQTAAAELEGNPRLAEIVYHPARAANEKEALVALKQRQLFIVAMNQASLTKKAAAPHAPMDAGSKWTRWKSVERVTKGLVEVAQGLDPDSRVEFMHWAGHPDFLQLSDNFEIENFFRNTPPATNSAELTPALEALYLTKLEPLLRASEPFNVVILFDSEPSDPGAVKGFFQRIEHDQELNHPDRDALAVFSFVQIGDHSRTKEYCDYLDREFKKPGDNSIDLVRTAKDSYLFGTEAKQGFLSKTFSGKKFTPMGPFALLWDSIFKG